MLTPLTAPAAGAALTLAGLLLTAAGCTTACAGTRAGATCGDAVARVERRARLPGAVNESSGLARTRSADGGVVLWTHNDDGPPLLYALAPDGALRARVRVPGVRNVDWEASSTGPCPSGTCLYIGQTGDNDERRDDRAIYRIPVPDVPVAAPGRAPELTSAPPEVLPLVFPGRRHDVEAIYVSDDGAVHLITKGRAGVILHFRADPARWRPLDADEPPVLLEQQTELPLTIAGFDDTVTDAARAPDGRTLGVRTYHSLHLFDVDPLTGAIGAERRGARCDLSPLDERQGEGLAPGGSAGEWILASEGRRAPLLWIRCAPGSPAVPR